MNSILVIDDDQELCALLLEYLPLEGFTAHAESDPLRGVEEAVSGKHSLAVLDVMLPGLDGFEALRRIRLASGIPVLMLTACGDDSDRILGLEIGADDYLRKPFNPRELAARIRAVLRRATVPASGTGTVGEFRAGDVALSPASRIATLSGEPLALTSVEFSILEALLRNAGRCVSREDLVRLGLGREYMASDRSIDVHVSNLRKKLGRGGDGIDRIKTIRGAGYLYAVR